MFGNLFGGGDKEEDVMAASPSSEEPKKKGFFGAFGDAFSAATSYVGRALSSVGKAFATKEDEEAKRARLAEEAAAAEEKRQQERDLEKRLNELERKRKAEQELKEKQKEMERYVLGHPTEWRRRYKTSKAEVSKRAWYDASTFSWDGSVFVSDLNDRQKNIQIPASKLRIFCSSTFTDTHKERNRLLGPVYKKVRAFAEMKGIDFSFIDMRYGVRDENTLDHNTWEACKAELMRCKAESANLFFLSLQGQKYGYQCLPKYIPQEAFDEARKARGTKETKEYARTWYLLDANQMPPRFTLKNLSRLQLWATAKEDGRTDEYDNSYWDMFDRLRNMLDGVQFDPEVSNQLTIGQSVTDWELISGTLNEDDCRRAFWVHREFVDNKVWPKKYTQNGPDKFAYWDYNDTHIDHSNEKAGKATNDDYVNLHSAYNQERSHLRRKEARLQALKERMRDKLGNFNNVTDFKKLQFTSVQRQDNFFKNYMNRFVEVSEELLLDNVTATGEELAHWTFDGCGRGIDGANLSEFCHHINWAKTKIGSFEGRGELVARCVEVVRAPNNVSTSDFDPDSGPGMGTLDKGSIGPGNAFQGISLAVVGISGSGKTALLSRVTQAVKERDVKDGVTRLFVVRFCGTSNASTDALSLVQSICKQIIASTQEPVEPLVVGSQVLFLLDGYAWVKGTITKAHDDGAFDIEYVEGVDAGDDDDFTPVTPQRGNRAKAEQQQQQKKKKKKMEKAPNQTRREHKIRLTKSSQDDFLHARSVIQVKLDAQDIDAEREYMKEAAGAKAAAGEEARLAAVEEEAARRNNPEVAKIAPAPKPTVSATPAIAATTEKEAAQEQELELEQMEEAHEEDSDPEPEDEGWFGEKQRDDSASWRDGIVDRINADGTIDLTYTSKDGSVKIRKLGEFKGKVRAKRMGTRAEGKIWNFRQVPDSYDLAVTMLHRLLARYPVVLIIDSLDQLNNNYRGRSEISFLRGVVPHPQTRIIVSTLPDNAQYFYLCDTRLERSAVPRVVVDPLVKDENIAEVRAMAEAMLAKQSRALTERQWAVFEKSILAEPTALYVNLAVNSVLCKWPSYATDSAELQLTPTVRGLIGQIFDTLERDFGKTLVDAALIILTLSMEGVSDVEMQDLLSIDDKVLNFVFQYSRPDVERLPYHVWLRLRASLGSLLVEKEGGCLSWYHRQLREVGLKRFSSADKSYYSALMGRYFGNLLDKDLCEARLVKQQSLVLNYSEVFLPEAQINHRRCIEASHHLIQAGLYDAAIDEICSVQAIYANARTSRSHCFVYLERVLHLHSIFTRMKSMGMRRARRIAGEIEEILSWQTRRVDVVRSIAKEQMDSITGENPDMTEQASGILLDIMIDQLGDVRKSVNFQHMLSAHPDFFSRYPGTDPAFLQEHLLHQFPLQMRSIVEHLGDASKKVLKHFKVELEDEDIIAALSQEETAREEALKLLYEERDAEMLDYAAYVSNRNAKLKRDFDVLSSLRSERFTIMEAKKADAFNRLRNDAKFLDKAKVQAFYMQYLDDVRKCRSFIGKYKMTDRSDPDRDAARSVLEEDFSVPVEKDSFPERMVSLAEDIIKALGEHWAGAEDKLREVLFESAGQVFGDRDRMIRKMVNAQFAQIQAESVGVDLYKLRQVAHFMETAFEPSSLRGTLEQLCDKTRREEMIKHLPLERWREEVREKETAATKVKVEQGKDASRRSSVKSSSSSSSGAKDSGKSLKTLAEHLDELAAKTVNVVQECGADASGVIEEVYTQRYHEMEELGDTYQSYLQVLKEQRQVDEWLKNRTTIIQGYLRTTEDQIRAENPTAEEKVIAPIINLLEEKLGSLKLVRDMQGALQGDETFSYVGDFVKIRGALDDAFRPIKSDTGGDGANRVLRMAEGILALFEDHDLDKEHKAENKRELVETQKEEFEFLFDKYRMYLMQIETLRKWVRDRDSVIAFCVRECLHHIEDSMPAVSAKQLRVANSYLVDNLRTLGGAQALASSLQTGGLGLTREEACAQLDAQVPLFLSAEQLAADEEARKDFYVRKEARAALLAQRQAEAALLDDALQEEEGADKEDQPKLEKEDEKKGEEGEVEVGSSPLGLDESPFGDSSLLQQAEEGVDGGEKEGGEDLDQEYLSPLRKLTFSSRLVAMVHSVFSRMEDSSFDMVDNEASQAAKELGVLEMEELEIIFQSYRNPRLAHLRKFEHYQRLLQQEMSFISSDPLCNTYLACERQPYLSEARKDFLGMFASYKRSKKALNLSHVSHRDQVVPLYRSVGGLSHTFGPLVSMFSSHAGDVLAVCISPNEDFVVSGGRDKTVKVWDAGLGNVTLDLEGHEGAVTAVCVTPDNKGIVSASADGSIRVWETKTGKMLQVISRVHSGDGTRSGKHSETGHRGAVLSIVVSPDGGRVVSGGEDYAAMVWDLPTGHCLKVIDHNSPVRSICYTPDGSKIVTGSGVDAEVSEGAEKPQVGAGKKDRDAPDAAPPSSSGTMGCVSIFDALSFLPAVPPISCFHGHVSSVSASDGRVAAAGSSAKDIVFYIFDLGTGTRSAFKGHLNKVTAVDISVDGSRVASGSWDDSARFWNAETGHLIQTMEGHAGNVNQVRLAPSGAGLYTASSDETVGIWDPTAVKNITSSSAIIDTICSVNTSADGTRVVVQVGNRDLKLYSVINSKHLGDIECESAIACTALSPDGCTVVVALMDKCVYVWREGAAGGDFVQAMRLEGHTEDINAVCVSSSMVFSGSNDGSMRAYDLHTGAFKQTFSGHKAAITAIAVCPDKEQHSAFQHEETATDASMSMSSPERERGGRSEVEEEGIVDPSLSLSRHGSPGFLSLDFPEGRGSGSRAIPGSPGIVVSQKYLVKSGKKMPWEESPYSPDKSEHKDKDPMDPFVVTGSKDNTAIIWSLATGKPLHVLRGKPAPALEDAPKNANARKKLASLEGHTRPIRSVAVDYALPSRPRVITASDDDLVKIWSAKYGNVEGTLEGHSAEVRSVAVSADGRRIITGSEDKTVKIWDGHVHEELMTLRGHTSSLLHVFLSLDGTSLLSCAEDNTVKVWRFIGRDHKKADFMDQLTGAARREQLIKNSRISFKERVVSHS